MADVAPQLQIPAGRSWNDPGIMHPALTLEAGWRVTDKFRCRKCGENVYLHPYSNYNAACLACKIRTSAPSKDFVRTDLESVKTE